MVQRRRAARPKPSRPVTARPAAKPAEKVAEKHVVPPTYFVAVLGDSLGQLLGTGLTEAFTDHPEVAILRKARQDTGLVRDDFYDWNKATHDLLESGEKINFAAILIGANDRQAVHEGNQTYELRSPEWKEIYGRRIEAIATQFHDKKIPLIWVGLPVMKSERLSADISAFNEFFKEHAEKAGATFVDIWEAFGDDHGQYSAFGPDINGEIVRLRAADGVHFTKAGARKVAHFIEAAIRRNLEEIEPPTDPAISNLPAPETNAPAENAAIPPVVKPDAGPVLPLTGPVLAPGGQLTTRGTQPAPKADSAGTLIDQALTKGKPLDSKPGRADDFAWPRP